MSNLVIEDDGKRARISINGRKIKDIIVRYKIYRQYGKTKVELQLAPQTVKLKLNYNDAELKVKT